MGARERGPRWGENAILNNGGKTPEATHVQSASMGHAAHAHTGHTGHAHTVGLDWRGHTRGWCR
eukprot:7714584-Pyramimonas_sp.AAC.1